MRVNPERVPVWFLCLLISSIIFGASSVSADEADGDIGSSRNLLASAGNGDGDSSQQIPAGFENVEVTFSPVGVGLAFLQGSSDLPESFTVETAVAWALNHNREIERLRFEVDAATAADRGSGLLYMPNLDLGLRSMSMGPASTIEVPGIGEEPMEIETGTTDITSTVSLTLTQPVHMFGAFSLAQRGSSIALDQARLQLGRMSQTVARDVEEAFLLASLARELVTIAERAVETAGERLRISEVRFDEGDVARFEVLRSEVALATTREELLQTETAAELAMSAFIQKLGLPPETMVGITPPNPDSVEPTPPDFSLEEAREMAYENRLDLRTLELGVDLAEIGVSSSRNRPALVFQGNYSLSDRAGSFSNRESWSVALNLSYALFDSGRSEALIDEASARRDALSVQTEDVRTLIALEVESAYLAIQESLERITVSRATLDSASEALRIAELGYSEGVIRYIDYQDADLGYSQAETFYLQAVYRYLIAQSSLRAAIGLGP